jgi:hypothetical protein
VDVVKPQIRALPAELPEMPSTMIMERVGWERGKTVLVFPWGRSPTCA